MLQVRKEDKRKIRYRYSGNTTWKDGFLYGIVNGYALTANDKIPESQYLIEDKNTKDVRAYAIQTTELRFDD